MLRNGVFIVIVAIHNQIVVDVSSAGWQGMPQIQKQQKQIQRKNIKKLNRYTCKATRQTKKVVNAKHISDIGSAQHIFHKNT